MNHEFQNRMRHATCYPAFRGFVTVATWLLYLAAAALALFALFAGARATDGGAGLLTIVTGVGVALIGALLVTVLKEAVLMLADIADATIGVAARHYDEQEPAVAAFEEADINALVARGRHG